MVTFKGKEVIKDANYPAIYLPEHPVARPNGMAHIHRIVMYKELGGIPNGYHVHHKDGDIWNWDFGNLELLLPKEHRYEHTPDVDIVSLYCNYCGSFIIKAPSSVNKKNYCNNKCSTKDREKINWPTVGALREAVYRISAVAVADLLGVSNVAVHKRIKNHGRVR